MPARPFERARRDVLALAAAAPVAAAFAATAPARASDDEAGVLDIVARWYGELRKQEEGRPELLLAAHRTLFIDRYQDPDEDCDAPVAKSAGPRFGFYRAYSAQRFAYEIRETRIDPRFAKVRTREILWRYASRAERTYQLFSGGTFVMERDEDDAWKILVYDSYGIDTPRSEYDDPMPDLSDGIHEPFVYRR